jgi:hypothetical protein
MYAQFLNLIKGQRFLPTHSPVNTIITDLKEVGYFINDGQVLGQHIADVVKKNLLYAGGCHVVRLVRNANPIHQN